MDAWIWIVIAVAVVLVVVLVAMAMARKRRRAHLQDRFGPEYGRTVDGADNRRAAERDLREREAKHDELELHPLSEASRQRYTQQWTEMQSGFVDRPQVAVADADRLITDLMRERGYPVDDFDTRSELVSVDHPDVVQNYRTAHTHRGAQRRGSDVDRGPAPGRDLVPRAVRGDAASTTANAPTPDPDARHGDGLGRQTGSSSSSW